MTTKRPFVLLYDRHATRTRTILDLRLEACRAYAKKQGWPIVGEWIDLGDHALLDDPRPEFHQLILRLWHAHRLSDRPVVVLIHDWDRLSHARAQQAIFSRRVELAGGWIETIAGETSRPAGRHRGLLTATRGPEADR